MSHADSQSLALAALKASAKVVLHITHGKQPDAYLASTDQYNLIRLQAVLVDAADEVRDEIQKMGAGNIRHPPSRKRKFDHTHESPPEAEIGVSEKKLAMNPKLPDHPPTPASKPVNLPVSNTAAAPTAPATTPAKPSTGLSRTPALRSRAALNLPEADAQGMDQLFQDLGPAIAAARATPKKTAATPSKRQSK